MMLCIVANAQDFSEVFENEDFRKEIWIGDTSSFIMSSDHMLQLNADAAAGQKYIATSCDVIDKAEWTIRCLTQFNPSSSNFSRIWIVADHSNPTMVNNGLYIEVGGSKDNIALYQVTVGVKKN